MIIHIHLLITKSISEWYFFKIHSFCIQYWDLKTYLITFLSSFSHLAHACLRQIVILLFAPKVFTALCISKVPTWGQSQNYFGVNLLTLFCNLDHFINNSNIYLIFMKRSSLQNRVSKFTPKKFYEIIDPINQGTQVREGLGCLFTLNYACNRTRDKSEKWMV